MSIALSMLGVAAPSATADTESLNGQFRLFFGKSTAHPCGAFVCGVGTVKGYGDATTNLFPTKPVSFNPETGCADIELFEEIILSNGSGTLELLESGLICYPSPKAAFAPGAVNGKSFGNPTSGTLTYTILCGSGVFDGAEGTGTVKLFLAGESGTKTVAGTM